MTDAGTRRCAIYTRKSSENGLEQAFNSLDAQREACEAYIRSQAHEGWLLRPVQYDDGGISGGHMERPALHALISDIQAGLVDVVVVYKVDRLSRSLADFVQMVRLFDQYDVSFVSITQQFNTSSSMGRLTLNVLLSFAQFEREVTSERIRDKIAASKRKGMWMGGNVPIGFDVVDKLLVVNREEASQVRHIFGRYLSLGCVRKLKSELDQNGHVSKVRPNGQGGKPFSRGALYTLLRNPLYVGKVKHKDQVFDGAQNRIVDDDIWEQVQAQLEANRSRAKQRSTAKARSLLAGLLSDDQGNCLSPTHTSKGQKRYRYYVNQALLKFEDIPISSVKRVPAGDIERNVIEQISALLLSPAELIQTAGLSGTAAALQKQVIERAAGLSKKLHQEGPAELAGLLKLVLLRIELSSTRLTISLNQDGLLQSLFGQEQIPRHEIADASLLKIIVPVCLQKCGTDTKLILGERCDQQAQSRSVAAIQKAVRQAIKWNNALLTGKARTLTELAAKEGLTQRYLSSLLPLAFLAPDIIKSIAKSDVPMELSLERIKDGVPLCWDKQRDLLNFAKGSLYF